MRQLALPFGETRGYAAEDFCPAPSNAAAREWLSRTEQWPQGRLLLWGEAGCGKTHLLRIWAAAHQAEFFEGAALQGLLRPLRPVAVDDTDIVAEPRALLHLINAAGETGVPLLMSARLPPGRQAFKLADLASRLRATQAVEIRPPEEELLELLLARLAAERQLRLGLSVRNFMLLHLPRTAAAFREAVARLDHATLDRGTKVTRQLASEVLADLMQPD
ncbi:MAG: hypothetical protein B7Z80_04445 [Rhodospirillales bacterium 20-64-7]|nr:MAG: hypothetical protein B7Z80_04445 [Rhodospirillales bacterium 20-64-7]